MPVTPAPSAPVPTPAVPASARPNRTWLTWWPWALGLLSGLVLLGPGLAPGSLLSLDLVLTPRIPLPPGVWGLGPALPQRVPSFVPLAGLSALVGGPTAGKAFLVAAVAVAFAGAARLVGDAGPVPKAAAGLLLAAGPFAATRIGAGHLNVAWALAALPWAVPPLLRPSEDLRRTFLAALAVAAAGSAGGSLLGVVVLVGLLTEPRPRRVVRVLAVAGVTNVVWLLPDLVVLWAGAEVRGGDAFRTHLPDLPAAVGLLAGGGFWRGDFQVGARGVVAAVASLVLLGLALLGHRDLPARVRRGLGVLGGVGLVLAAASAVPGLRSAYGALTDLPFGAPFRESGRMVVLWLLWAAPAAALGGARAARLLRSRAGSGSGWAGGLSAVAGASAVVVALVLAAPGAWGVGGRLDPVAFPRGWSHVRAIVGERPGTVLALPWHEYLPLGFADDRSVLNPLPDFVGGDVLSSYDPEFDPEHRAQEQVDHRARRIDDVLDRFLDPDVARPLGPTLQQLGVRWVVLAHESDWDRYVRLYQDPALRLAWSDASVDLFAVRGWAAPAVERPVGPVLRTGAPPGRALPVPAAPGWVRGFGRSAPSRADGRLVVPDGSGPLWFWPAIALLVADAALLAAVGWAVASLRRSWGRPDQRPSGETLQRGEDRPTG